MCTLWDSVKILLCLSASTNKCIKTPHTQKHTSLKNTHAGFASCISGEPQASFVAAGEAARLKNAVGIQMAFTTLLLHTGTHDPSQPQSRQFHRNPTASTHKTKNMHACVYKNIISSPLVLIFLHIFQSPPPRNLKTGAVSWNGTSTDYFNHFLKWFSQLRPFLQALVSSVLWLQLWLVTAGHSDLKGSGCVF